MLSELIELSEMLKPEHGKTVAINKADGAFMLLRDASGIIEYTFSTELFAYLQQIFAGYVWTLREEHNIDYAFCTVDTSVIKADLESLIRKIIIDDTLSSLIK